MLKFVNPDEVQLPRTTKGKRPYFFDNSDIDQLMTFIVELTTEVMVLRERQDTVERLLDQKGCISKVDIEEFVVKDGIEKDRAAARDAFVNRVLRIHAPEGRQD